MITNISTGIDWILSPGDSILEGLLKIFIILLFNSFIGIKIGRYISYKMWNNHKEKMKTEYWWYY